MRAEQRRKEKLVRPMRCNTDDETQQLNVEVQVDNDEHDEENEQVEQEDDALSQGMAAEEVGEAGQEEEPEIHAGEEEGRTAVGMTTPKMVSRKEREEHELTHLPYRSWCEHCVRGRGRTTAHKQIQHDREVELPRVSIDYFFLNDTDKEKNVNPMIVAVDESTGEKYGRVVEHKGLREGTDGSWIVSDLLAEM